MAVIRIFIMVSRPFRLFRLRFASREVKPCFEDDSALRNEPTSAFVHFGNVFPAIPISSFPAIIQIHVIPVPTKFQLIAIYNPRHSKICDPLIWRVWRSGKKKGGYDHSSHKSMNPGHFSHIALGSHPRQDQNLFRS